MKDKEIEGMQIRICNACKQYKKCDKELCTMSELVAKELSRFYQPKLPEDSVVLSKEKYSDYLILQQNHEFIREKAKELQADNERLYKNLGKFKGLVSKETAEKIYDFVERYIMDDAEVELLVKQWFEEQFGVEIKE